MTISIQQGIFLLTGIAYIILAVLIYIYAKKAKYQGNVSTDMMFDNIISNSIALIALGVLYLIFSFIYTYHKYRTLLVLMPLNVIAFVLTMQIYQIVRNLTDFISSNIKDADLSYLQKVRILNWLFLYTSLINTGYTSNMLYKIKNTI